MKARILLRRTSDGAERWADPHPGQAGASLWDWPNPSWTEGNLSCDCNRGSTFGDDDVSCGESAYRIARVEAEDGRVLTVGEDARGEVERLEEAARAIPETGAPDSYLRAYGGTFLLEDPPVEIRGRVAHLGDRPVGVVCQQATGRLDAVEVMMGGGMSRDEAEAFFRRRSELLARLSPPAPWP